MSIRAIVWCLNDVYNDKAIFDASLRSNLQQLALFSLVVQFLALLVMLVEGIKVNLQIVIWSSSNNLLEKEEQIHRSPSANQPWHLAFATLCQFSQVASKEKEGK